MKGFQAVIKSSASAASLDLQGGPQTMARHADDGDGGLPCILVILVGEAALAADLLTRLIFKQLEQNLAIWNVVCWGCILDGKVQ